MAGGVDDTNIHNIYTNREMYIYMVIVSYHQQSMQRARLECADQDIRMKRKS
jgi:hypothetical protein